MRKPHKTKDRRTATGAVAGFSGSTTTELIRVVKRGLPLSVFERLRQDLGVSTGILAGAVQIAPRTLARRRQEGRLEADESERVVRIGLLWDRARAVLGGRDAARAWMTAPSRALGGATPLQFADTEPGAREVENLLGRIEHGVFS